MKTLRSILLVVLLLLPTSLLAMYRVAYRLAALSTGKALPVVRQMQPSGRTQFPKLFSSAAKERCVYCDRLPPEEPEVQAEQLGAERRIEHARAVLAQVKKHNLRKAYAALREQRRLIEQAADDVRSVWRDPDNKIKGSVLNSLGQELDEERCKIEDYMDDLGEEWRKTPDWRLP